MKSLPRMGIVMLLWIASAIAVTAAEDLPDRFMTVDQIHPGMIAEGLTVFQGYAIEPFRVEILGVEHNAMPGGDMILGRVDDPRFENHGVAAGMSGSPVFIDGKLIGALAYGWNFSYKPYCGIQPIEQMWTVWNGIDKPGLRESDARRAASGDGDRAWDWASDWDRYRARIDSDEATPSPAAVHGFRPTNPALSGVDGEMRPLWAPMFLSGASERSRNQLRNYLGSMGIELFDAGGLVGGAGEEPAPPLENGSALGIPILTGDLSLAAVGTVTYREGDKLIAFGHPMFLMGGVSAPMSAAYTFGIMQSYARPFKLSAAREIVGTLDQDRLFGVGGMFNDGPPRVPIRVTVEGPAASRPRTYAFSCWRNRMFLPIMTRIAIAESYTGSVAAGGELTAETTTRITLDDGRRIDNRFIDSSDVPPIFPVLMTMMRDLFLLIENPFLEADIASIDVSIHVRPGIALDRLLWVQPGRSQYRPGDRVRLQARFQRWRADEYERTFEMDLPDDLKPGVYVLHLADAAGSLAIESAHHPGQFQPYDFDDLFDLIGRLATPANQLRLYLFEPAVELDLQGHAMGNLPTSTMQLIQATAPGYLQQKAIGRLVTRRTEHTEAPVSGNASMAIGVRKDLER